MNRLLILLGFSLLIIPLMAQQREVMEFSLREAQAYATDHNYDIQNAITEIEISRKKMKEATSIGLPQVNGDIDYKDFLDIPTQMIPGEFFGEPPGTYIPVKFGTEYNMTLQASASQMIFSGEYIVALQASKTFIQSSEREHEKMLIELQQKVAESYYLVLIAERNKTIVDSILSTLKNIRNANVALFENGFIEETDIDQVDLLISNLEATQMDIVNNLQVSKNLLKFQMGLQLDNKIVLTDNLDMLMNKLDKDLLFAATFDYRKNIDYRILQNKQELATLGLKREKSRFLPSLHAFFSVSKTAQRNTWNFFSGDGDWKPLEQDQGWYNSTVFGVKMNIPILSSGSRMAKVQQSKLKLKQLEVMDHKVKAGLEIQFSTLQNTFVNAWKVYQNKKKGLDLSWKIYRKTQEKQMEGVSSSMELQQNYNQYLNSERDYVMAMLNLLKAKLNLERLLTEVN